MTTQKDKRRRLIREESDDDDDDDDDEYDCDRYANKRRRVYEDNASSIVDNGEGPSTIKTNIVIDDKEDDEEEDNVNDDDVDDERCSMYSAYSDNTKGKQPQSRPLPSIRKVNRMRLPLPYRYKKEGIPPEIFVVISGMGTGKTELLKKLTRMIPSWNHPSYISISPRRLLATFMADMLGFTDYLSKDKLQKGAKGCPQVAKMTMPELMRAQKRLAICINSVRHLSGCSYDVVILDEFYTTALMLASKLMLPRVQETIKVLNSIIMKAKTVILLAADGDYETIQTMLPFINWMNPDPDRLQIIVNEGGEGGIRNHQTFLSDELEVTCRLLKRYILEGKSVYVPTNQARYAEKLVTFCKQLGLQDDQILHIDGHSSKKSMKKMIRDPLTVLGYRDNIDLTPIPGQTQIRVFIATSAYGVGFSIKSGIFDVTIGFFFTYPLTVQGNTQQLARPRGNKERTIFCYYQKQGSVVANSQYELENMKKAVNTLNQNLADFEEEEEEEEEEERGEVDGVYISTDVGVVDVGISADDDDGDDTCSRIFSDGPWQTYAIMLENFQRRSRYDGRGMFLENVEKATTIQPLLLHSWMVNFGHGPLQVLPDLTEYEKEIVSSNRSTFNIDDDDLPTKQDEMMEWYNRQTEGDDMTKIETSCIQLFKLLPVPTGNLKEDERTLSFIKRLNTICRALDVMANGTERPLKVRDMKKHVRSMGISTVYRDEREQQQYQLYDIWSRIAIAGLPDVNYENVDGNDSGVILFEEIVNACNVGDGDDINDDSETKLVFNVLVHRLKEAITNVESMLISIKRVDTDVSEWFIQKNWSKFVKNCTKNDEKNIVVNYSTILRKGFRQLFGTSNVQIKSIKNRFIVNVTIKNLRRLIALSCIRRVAINEKSKVNLISRNFSVLESFRSHQALTNLIPSNKKLMDLCGICK